MKSVLFWMLRHLGIPAGFMLATGLPQFLHNTSWDTKDPSNDFTQEEFKSLEITPANFLNYCEALKKTREQEIKKNRDL